MSAVEKRKEVSSGGLAWIRLAICVARVRRDGRHGDAGPGAGAGFDRLPAAERDHRSPPHRDHRDRHAERFLRQGRLGRSSRRRLPARPRADRAVTAVAAGRCARPACRSSGSIGATGPISPTCRRTRFISTSRTASASAWAIRCQAAARTCWKRIPGPPPSSTSSKQEPHDIKVDKYRISGFWDTPLD